MFIKAVFPIPVHQYYYYSVPEKLEGLVQVGKRVKVDFNNRTMLGFVIEILREIKVEDRVEIKPVLDVADDAPLFRENLLRLARWISDYYYASLGEVLKLILPSATKMKEYLYPEHPQEKESITLTPDQQEIFQQLVRLEQPDYALIYGVTGSGKTEIFLSLIEHFLKKKSRSFILSLKYRSPRS